MSRLICTALLLLGLTVALAAQDREVAPMQITAYGDVYPSACLPKESARLKQEITRLAGQRNPAGAWALAKAMLCGTSPEAERFVLAHMPAQVQTSDASTDDGPEGPQREAVAPHAGLLCRGWAFGVTANGGVDDIVVQFQSGEVSVGSFTMTFSGKDWQIVSLDSASD